MNSENNSIEIAELLKQRDSLRTRLESIEQDYRNGLSADSEEQAIQLENAEVLEGIAKAASEELSQVEGRLSQLRDATAK